MVTKRRSGKLARKRPTAAAKRARARTSPSKSRFVGRDPSPVLDHYPPKDPGISMRGPVVPSTPTPSRTPGPPAPATPKPASPPAATPPPSLIALARPFDVDDFSQTLGENSVRVTVPREDLAEVLRRITDFMGFGIYVYRFTVRPAPSDQLKSFIVDLERVDYSPSDKEWVLFEEKGRSESPFGPGSTR